MLSVFGIGKMENLIMRLNIFVQTSDLVLKGKLADDRLKEFKIYSQQELILYHIKKELMELHEEMNNLPSILFETDKRLF